jgi:hypothetical protein
MLPPIMWPASELNFFIYQSMRNEEHMFYSHTQPHMEALAQSCHISILSVTAQE